LPPDASAEACAAYEFLFRRAYGYYDFPELRDFAPCERDKAIQAFAERHQTLVALGLEAPNVDEEGYDEYDAEEMRLINAAGVSYGDWMAQMLGLENYAEGDVLPFIERWEREIGDRPVDAATVLPLCCECEREYWDKHGLTARSRSDIERALPFHLDTYANYPLWGRRIEREDALYRLVTQESRL
jgi:hypothetical protein